MRFFILNFKIMHYLCKRIRTNRATRPVFENHIEQHNNMQDLKALEGKSLAELREIAKALGIKNIMIKKRELIAKIAGNTPPEEAAPAEPKQEKKEEEAPRAAVREKARADAVRG